MFSGTSTVSTGHPNCHVALRCEKCRPDVRQTIYDEVRYSNYPYAQTHPDRLATVAILHGLEPPDPFTSRVLEIGCGAGGNLMAMAAATPGHPRAWGWISPPAPIAEAQRAVAEIGLTNVELRQGGRPRADEREARANSTT